MKKFIFFTVMLLVISNVFALHTSNLTIIPNYSKANVTFNVTFKICNEGPDSVYFLFLSARDTNNRDPWNITKGVCPVGWEKLVISDPDNDNYFDEIICEDTNNDANLLAGECTLVNLTLHSLNVSSDLNFNWTLYTRDLSSDIDPLKSAAVIDVTPPEIIFANYSPRYLNYTNSTPFVYVKVNDSSGIKNCSYKLNNGTWIRGNNNNTYCYFIPNLTNNNYNITIKIYDKVGFSSEDEIKNILVDHQKPIGSDNYTLSGWQPSNQLVHLNCTDDIGCKGFYYCISEKNCTPIDFVSGNETNILVSCQTGNACKFHLFYQAVDFVDNKDDLRMTSRIDIDKKGPEINLNNLKNDSWVSGIVQFNLTLADEVAINISSFKFNLNCSTMKLNESEICNSKNTTCTFILYYNLSNLTSYCRLNVSAEDIFGNFNYKSITFGVDSFNPKIKSINLSKTSLTLFENIIVVTVNVSSFSPINSVIATIKDPSGNRVNLSLNHVNGLWKNNYTVTKYGTYLLSDVYVADAAGNIAHNLTNLSFSLNTYCGNGVCEPGETCSPDCRRHSSSSSSSSFQIIYINNKSNEKNINESEKSGSKNISKTTTTKSISQKEKFSSSSTPVSGMTAPASGMTGAVVGPGAQTSAIFASVIISLSIFTILLHLLRFKTLKYKIK